MAPGKAPSAAEARLDVLTRQLTGALALEPSSPPPVAADAAGAAMLARAVAATCPRQMAAYLVVRACADGSRGDG